MEQKESGNVAASMPAVEMPLRISFEAGRRKCRFCCRNSRNQITSSPREKTSFSSGAERTFSVGTFLLAETICCLFLLLSLLPRSATTTFSSPVQPNSSPSSVLFMTTAAKVSINQNTRVFLDCDQNFGAHQQCLDSRFHDQRNCSSCLLSGRQVAVRRWSSNVTPQFFCFCSASPRWNARHFCHLFWLSNSTEANNRFRRPGCWFTTIDGKSTKPRQTGRCCLDQAAQLLQPPQYSVSAVFLSSSVTSPIVNITDCSFRRFPPRGKDKFQPFVSPTGKSNKLQTLMFPRARKRFCGMHRLLLPRQQQSQRRRSPLPCYGVTAKTTSLIPVEVSNYFSNEGFQRWVRIYDGDPNDLNAVLRDIRKGHRILVNTLMTWLLGSERQRLTWGNVLAERIRRLLLQVDSCFESGLKQTPQLLSGPVRVCMNSIFKLMHIEKDCRLASAKKKLSSDARDATAYDSLEAPEREDQQDAIIPGNTQGGKTATSPLQDASVLDVGCGTGSVAIEMLVRGRPRMVVAIDISLPMLRQASLNARTRLRDDELSRLHFARADLFLRQLQAQPHTEVAPREPLDVLVCIDVLTHLHPDDMQEALSRLASLTRRDLFISIPPKRWYFQVLHGVGRLLPKAVAAPPTFLHDDLQLQDALHRRGFEIKASKLVSTKFYHSKLFWARRRCPFTL